jgi:hypothetical protein
VKGRIANLHHWRCRIHPRMARLKSRRGSGFALRGGVAVHSADRVTTPIVGAWRACASAVADRRRVPTCVRARCFRRSLGLNRVRSRIV